MDRLPHRVEVVISVRTLLVLLAFATLVALAIVSVGTLLSTFVRAAVASEHPRELASAMDH
jgi:hypothetical protein